MVCKKCGYGPLIPDGDWLKCPSCGAEFFNTKIDPSISATMQLDMLDEQDKKNSIFNNGSNDSDNNSSKAKKSSSQGFFISETEPDEFNEDEAESLENIFSDKEETVEEVDNSSEELSKKELKAIEKEKMKQQKEQEKQQKLKEKEEKEAFKLKEKEEKEALKLKEKEEKEALKNKEKEQKQSKKKKKKDNSEDKKEDKKQSTLKNIVDFLIPIVVAVIIALLLKSFVFANAVVPTGSMIATINEGDRIIASRLAYIKDDPQRYDIVLFDFPDDETKIYVKRIIGMPGETLTVVNGIVYITDESGQMYRTDDTFVTNEIPIGDFGPYYIPKMGEHIKTDNIQCYAENGMVVGGEEFLDKYCVKDKNGNLVKNDDETYTVAENNYFCMGDNRNNSLDSRYWDNTYVSESKILGQAMFKYYPHFEELDN